MDQLRSDDRRHVGPYEVLGRLGAGGMGEVFLGRSPGGKLVALKVIRPEWADDAEFRARFRREAAAMKMVSGAYTAPVIQADPDGSPAWLATAYIEAPSLADAVRQRGPLPQPEVLNLAAGLAEALWAIHREGLTHRDLKPANVLLAADGPRVIDFGLAVTAENSALTRTGVVIGTPSYMAPEQISGSGATPASDVFALGAVLAFAATGRPPYGGGSPAELVYRIVHGEPDLTGVEAPLLEVVWACLAKDPMRRPEPTALLTMVNGTPFVEPTQDAMAVPGSAPGTVKAPDTADAGGARTAPAAGGPRRRRRSTLLKAGFTITILATLAAIVTVMAIAAGSLFQKTPDQPARQAGKTPSGPIVPIPSMPKSVEGSALKVSDEPSEISRMQRAQYTDVHDALYGDGTATLRNGLSGVTYSFLYDVAVARDPDGYVFRDLSTDANWAHEKTSIPGLVICDTGQYSSADCIWMDGDVVMWVLAGAQDRKTFTDAQLVKIIENIHAGTER